jgi:hypothetical protein
MVEHGAFMLIFIGSPMCGRIVGLLPRVMLLDGFATHALIVNRVAASHVD